MRGSYSSEKVVQQIFIDRYRQVHGHHLKDDVFNLIIWDSQDTAGDNGEYLYRMIRRLRPDTRMVFLTSGDDKKFGSLKKDGFNTYPFDGKDIEFMFKNASFILFSKETFWKMPVRELSKTYRDKCVFLQHGVTATIYNDDFYWQTLVGKVSKWACCTSDDEHKVVDTYSKKSVTPIVTGFPRHDFLLEKHRKYMSTPHPRRIFISFHWRKNLDEKQDKFAASDYLKDINNLLGCNEMKELANKSGTKIWFLPHARIMKFLRFFKIPDYVEVPKDKQFQDILVESDLLVTDFSSNSFEMAYMDKPTVSYVPGIEHVRREMT